MSSINYRKPSVETEVIRYPTGAISFLRVVDDCEMFLSAHQTFEPERHNQLRIAVGAENMNSFGVYLTVDAVYALIDACNSFLSEIK